MILFTWALFLIFNIMALQLVIKYIIKSKHDNISIFHILACIIINLGIVNFHIGEIKPFSLSTYTLFLIVFFCGGYALYKLYKLLLVPTHRANKWFLPDEEKNRLPVKESEKKIFIAVYFISLLFSFIALITN